MVPRSDRKDRKYKNDTKNKYREQAERQAQMVNPVGKEQRKIEKKLKKIDKKKSLIEKQISDGRIEDVLNEKLLIPEE